jgi:heme/copper-type cytochrome/quinol oxidase subunit 1
LAVPAFLETIERSGLSTWIRESESAFAYYFVLVIHNIGLALLVGTCGVLGAVLLGFVPELPIAPLRRFFRFIWIGFWLNVVSGVFLLIAYPTKALTNPLFYVKLVLVAIGVWTLRRIEREVEVRRSLALWMLGSWLGVLTAGRALAYTASYILYGKGT